jgi:6-phosphogluconolactonase
MKIFRVCVARTFVFSLFLALAFLAQAKEELVYFGTFPKTGSKGIYVSRLDLETGKFSAPEVAAETSSAGFLAIHPNRQFLYAVGELQKPSEKPSGAVNAFAVDPKTGKLT